MSDEQTPRSGSRWEPAVPPPVTPPPGDEAGPAADTRRRSWRDRSGNRQRGLVLGALALVLVGGLGGAAVAHTVAGDDDGPDTAWVQESGPGADRPGAEQPGLQEPPGADVGRLPTWGDDADDADETDDADEADDVDGSDDADEHETQTDLGEHKGSEGSEAEHAGADT